MTNKFKTKEEMTDQERGWLTSVWEGFKALGLVSSENNIRDFDEELDDIEAGESQSIWPLVMGRYD